MLRICTGLALVMALACSSQGGPPGDAGSDARVDTGGDTGTDTGVDSSVDSGGVDSSIDAGDDAATDAAADAGADATAGCTDTSCGAMSYCDFGGDCGTASTGMCEPRPEICPTDCPGVCGCDGRTYCNACTAASMGVDLDPDGTCMGPDCAAMDARGEGACDLFLGYVWDGRACTGVSGCRCAGTDCGDIYASMAACDATYRDCTVTRCGGRRGDTCARDEWCDFDGGGCGFADGEGTCQPRPEACLDVFDPVCGCDSMTYSNGCRAHAAGQDVLSTGACGAEPPPAF